MLSACLTIFFIFLLINYLYFLSRIFRGLSLLGYSKPRRLPEELVSIIIPFRNESENILNSLDSIENQDYPKNKFEVVYVNDSSSDDSLEKLSYAKKSGNIRILSVPKSYSINAHKKRAIRFAIEHSSGGIIVATDADCIHSENWLSSLLEMFDKSTGFVSGPVEFIANNTLFSKLQKLEFAGLVFSGAGLIGIDKPTICNAANIAYRKSVYKMVNGFNDNLNLSSGDDELLMQKIRKVTDYKIKFCVDKDSIVKTQANETLGKFYHQRKRWASKGLFYADKLLVVKLILIFLFYLSLFLMPLAAIFLSINFIVLLASGFILKMLFEYLILKRGARLFYGMDLLKYIFVAELLHVPYIIIAGFVGAFGNFKWKDREVKR